MKKTKILHIPNYYYPSIGGIEQTSRDCVNSLKDQYENKVICFNTINKDSIDYVDNIEIIRCRKNIKVRSQPLSSSYSRYLKQVIMDYKPNIIIFYYPNPFVAHYLLKLIPNDCKFILYWHLDIVKQKILGKLFYKQNIKLLERADVVLATSDNYIDGSPWLSQYKDKCKVINSCINEERLEINDKVMYLANTIKKENCDKTICLAYGRHVKYKGFEYLIKASKYLDDTFKIYLIGKGKLTNKLKKLAKNDLKIQFLGHVSDEVLKAYLLSTDILCFPSITKNEAFGLALAEGMYFKKPAVTFTIKGSGVNYVCLNKENGIEVENKNVLEYAEAIKLLASNNELRNKLGKQAQKRVIEKFTYDIYSRKILDIIELITNKGQ